MTNEEMCKSNSVFYCGGYHLQILSNLRVGTNAFHFNSNDLYESYGWYNMMKCMQVLNFANEGVNFMK
jgi:hypothetical protein